MASTNSGAISSLVFSDGFDYYVDPLQKWTSETGQYQILTPGRFPFGQRLQGNGALTKILNHGPYNRIVWGAAFNTIASPPQISNGGYIGSNRFMSLVGSQAQEIMYLGFDGLGRISYGSPPNGTFQAPAGPTFASSPNLLPFGQWVYVEFDVILSNTNTGSFKVRLNGVEILSQTNVLTATENSAFGIQTVADNNNFYKWDDIYVLAPSSTVIGDSFLGDIKVIGITPNGAGQSSQMTQTGGVLGMNYTSVNEVPPNGDTSYVATNVPGQFDLYTLPTPNSITPVSAIYGVAAYSLSRKDDSPARFLSVGVGNGTTSNFDAGSALGSDYHYVERVMPVNPLTGLPWALVDLNNLQLGIKLIS